MGTPSAGRLHRFLRKSCQEGCTGLFSKMSPHCLLTSLLLLSAASQAATQERGLFGDVLGGILGGENATAAETATDAASDGATDAAPSDIVGSLMQVIPAILASNGSLPMDQIGEAIGIQKEPIASPFTKPVQFAANPKVSAALAAAATMNGTAITGAVADLGAHLVLQQIFYGNMFTDTPLLDG